jgi:hypothetical protein
VCCLTAKVMLFGSGGWRHSPGLLVAGRLLGSPRADIAARTLPATAQLPRRPPSCTRRHRLPQRLVSPSAPVLHLISGFRWRQRAALRLPRPIFLALSILVASRAA